MEVMVATYEKFKEEADAMQPKPGERPTGSAKVRFAFQGASGTGPDGRMADGYVLLDKTRIRAKDKNSEKFRQARDLHDRARAEILKGFGEIVEPVYVDKFVLD
jgi:hypothetical protein